MALLLFINNFFNLYYTTMKETIACKVKKWKSQIEKWDFWEQLILAEKLLSWIKEDAWKKAQEFRFKPDVAIEGSLKKKFNELQTWLINHMHEKRQEIYGDQKKSFQPYCEQEKNIKKFFETFFSYLVEDSLQLKQPKFERNDLEKEFCAFQYLRTYIVFYILKQEERFLKSLNGNESFKNMMEYMKFSEDKRKEYEDRAYCYFYSALCQIVATPNVACFSYGKDRRRWWEFANYFSEGWVMEEIVEEWLSQQLWNSSIFKNKGYNVSFKLGGDDKERMLSSGFKKISWDPDYVLSLEKQDENHNIKEQIKIELQKVQDYPNGKSLIHIKTHKFRKSRNMNSLILLVFPKAFKFSLFHANEFDDNYFVQQVEILKKWGNKPVHNLRKEDIEDVGVYDLMDESGIKKVSKKILKYKALDS